MPRDAGLEMLRLIVAGTCQLDVSYQYGYFHTRKIYILYNLIKSSRSYWLDLLLGMLRLLVSGTSELLRLRANNMYLNSEGGKLTSTTSRVLLSYRFELVLGNVKDTCERHA